MYIISEMMFLYSTMFVVIISTLVSFTWALNLDTINSRSPIYIAKTVEGKFCTIPFVYKGVTYHDCIMDGADKPWCSLDKVFVSGQSPWGYCLPPPKEYDGCALATPNVTMEEVEEILREHNSFRASIPARQMRKMEWNSELAMKAQVAANKCLGDHVESKLCADRFETGQNLFYSKDERYYPGQMTWTSVINYWSREGVDYDIKTLGCKADKLCGHYTQVVWDKSGQIGCGKSYCHGPLYGKPDNPPEYSIQYFCNYYQSGNYGGTPPYQITDKDRCQDCHTMDVTRKFRCTTDQLCEACQNDVEGCKGMDDVKLMVSQGKICADTMLSCEQNKQLCNMSRSGFLPPPFLEFLNNCNKTCNRC